MKNTNYFFATFVLTAALSCQKELTPADVESENNGESDNLVEMTFGVIGENDGTRTYIDGLDIKWDKDAISIIDDSMRVVGTTARTGNQKFTTTETGTTKTWFTGTAKEGAALYYAVSPYSKTAIVKTNDKAYGFESAPETGFAFPILNDRDGGLNIFLPSLQNPVKGSYDPKAHFLVGKTTRPDSLRMFNVGSLVKFTISTGSVKEVIFRGNDNEILGGLSLVKIAEDGVPSVSSTAFATATFRYIKAQPAEGAAFEPGDYYICTAPATLSNGITLSISDTLGRVADKMSYNPVELKRAGVITIGTIDTGLDWYEKQEILYLDFVNQDPSTSSPFNAEPYKSYKFQSTSYYKAENQFFSNYKNGYFPGSGADAKTKFAGKTIVGKLFTGDSVRVYMKNYISPNPCQGLRFSGCSVNFEGKAGKYINKVEFYGASGSSSVTILSQDSTAVEGGEVQTVGTGYVACWYPKLEAGKGIKLVSTFYTSMLRVYYSDTYVPAPANADTVFSRFVANQCSDAGTTATLRGAFAIKKGSADDFEYGFEYAQGSDEWTSVTAGKYDGSQAVSCTISGVTTKKTYYCFKADVSGLKCTETYKWRAWVKGSLDKSRKYGATKKMYPSKNNLVIEFADVPQVTKLDGHNALLSTLKTSSQMNASTQNYTLDFYSGFSFDLFDQHGVSKSTGNGGFTCSYLLLSPYHKDCAFTSEDGGNSWIKLPAREGKKLKSVTVTYSDETFKFNANLSATVDANGLGDASIAADTSLAGLTKIKLNASETAANTSYYLCFSPDADGTVTKTNSLCISKLEILYQ